MECIGKAIINSYGLRVSVPMTELHIKYPQLPLQATLSLLLIKILLLNLHKISQKYLTEKKLTLLHLTSIFNEMRILC